MKSITLSKYFIIAIIVILNCNLYPKFSIGRLKYGNGDWYSDPTSLPNLLNFVKNHTNLQTTEFEGTVNIGDGTLSNYPYLYFTGHGDIKFKDTQISMLREHLLNGGFLHVDDNYGLDKYFKKFIKKLFPKKELKLVPFSNPIYNIKYKFPTGLPKIHKHDNKAPQGYGIFSGKRLMVFYSYECDLGDGWEDEEVHHDSKKLRTKALQMGCNLILNFLYYDEK